MRQHESLTELNTLGSRWIFRLNCCTLEFALLGFDRMPTLKPNRAQVAREPTLGFEAAPLAYDIAQRSDATENIPGHGCHFPMRWSKMACAYATMSACYASASHGIFVHALSACAECMRGLRCIQMLYASHMSTCAVLLVRYAQVWLACMGRQEASEHKPNSCTPVRAAG